MADSFQGFFSSIMTTFVDTFKQETSFNSAIGDDFGRMTYPAASYIPESSDYQNNSEYGDTHTVLFVFEKEPDNINLISNVEEMEEAIDTVQTELGKNSTVGQYKPVNLRFLSADDGGTRLNVIEVQWSITKLQEFADYS